MNIIDLFKEYGFYDNSPSIDRFPLFVNDKYGGNDTTYHSIRVKGIKAWSHELKVEDDTMRSSGVFFFMTLYNMTDDTIRWRKEHPGNRFNNYWPKHGEIGEIDFHKTIEIVFENEGWI